MNGKCVDIGTIQAFLDGELEPQMSIRVTNHVADCDACAMLLAESDEENAMVFAALDREMNTLVPTQRLWGKINESITVERERTPFLQKVRSFILANLAVPSFATAAAVLLVFGIISAVWISRPEAPAVDGPALVAVNTAPIPDRIDEPAVPAVEAAEPVNDRAAETEIYTEPVRRSPAYTAVRAVYRSSRPAAKATRAVPAAINAVPAFLPGEESYVKTIAMMSENMQGRKDELMRPSERVAFERDMAVVNDAISRMRAEVRKNPKNEPAKQVLYSSYQNKIDLLNSVSQREELIASLK